MMKKQTKKALPMNKSDYRVLGISLMDNVLEASFPK